MQDKVQSYNMNKTLIILLYYIFFSTALFLVLLRWYLLSNRKSETAEIVGYLIIAFLAGACILRVGYSFFPKLFRDKSQPDDSNQDS